MIKALIFDCFGVLAISDLWKQFVDSQSDEVDKESLRDLNRALDAGLLSRESFMEQVYDLTGAYPKQVEDILSPEVGKDLLLLDKIRQLKNDGYLIGLLSNISSDWVKTVFLSAIEQELFDDMIMSYEVGLVKPDVRIFELACQRLSVMPEEAIFIDDVERNCSGAEAAGMKSILYTDLKSFMTQFELLTADSDN